MGFLSCPRALGPYFSVKCDTKEGTKAKSEQSPEVPRVSEEWEALTVKQSPLARTTHQQDLPAPSKHMDRPRQAIRMGKTGLSL